MKKEVLIFICHNAIPEGAVLEFQWSDASVHVEIRTLPCSGKISAEYLFHALEGGKDHLALIICPPGNCSLFQGNYRAQIRTENVKRLLVEIGMSADILKLMHFSKENSAADLDQLIRDYISGLVGINPVTILKKTG